jgi:hypothetical protein
VSDNGRVGPFDVGSKGKSSAPAASCNLNCVLHIWERFEFFLGVTWLWSDGYVLRFL